MATCGKMCSQVKDLVRYFNHFVGCDRLRNTKQSNMLCCKNIQQRNLHKDNTKLPTCRMMMNADADLTGSVPEKHLSM